MFFRNIFNISFVFSIILILGSSDAKATPGEPLKERFAYDSASNILEYYKEQNEGYYADLLREYMGEIQNKAVSWKQVAEAFLEGADFDEIDEERTITEIDIDLITNFTGKVPEIEVGWSGNSEASLLFTEETDSVSWEFQVPQTGLYEIAVDYNLYSGSANPAVFSVEIDGQVPFLEAYQIEFPRFFRDEDEPKFNNIGDEVRPRQTEIGGWRSVSITDSEGKYAQPLLFELRKGTHTLTLKIVEQGMAIGGIYIRRPMSIPSYQQLRELYHQRGIISADAAVRIQAEKYAVEKSDPTLRRESSGDPETEPYVTGLRRLNIIGHWRWRQGGQSITWRFDVPKTGLYKIGMRMGQWWNHGLSSYRKIEIDGIVPFKELLEYEFPYDREWKTGFLSSKDGSPFEFFLTKGTHTLTMTVQLGGMVDVVHSISEDSIALSRIIRKIIMITGSNPDPNYDYNLEDRIPSLLNDLSLIQQSMLLKVEKLSEISEGRPPIANNFLTIESQLRSMIRNPDRIPRKLNDLTNAQSSLGAWYLSIQQMPLAIDWFTFTGRDEKIERGKSNFFQKAAATFKNFLVSFKKDYDSVGNVYESGEEEKVLLDVWISRGIEWAEIIKEMADELFSPDSGILINMNVLPPNQLNAAAGNAAQAVNALMLAITSGRAPDVALGVSTTYPVEFAIREAAVNLKQFPDFNKVSERFLPRILAPFEYRGGVYGLPETMDFRLLFYRKDIIQELQIRLPDTWEDIYQEVLPVLYQNGMDFYYAIPTELGAIDHNFAPFLYQHGGTFYNKSGTKSVLDSPEAYQAFKEYTELFTSYGIPVVANFYNRMRTGEMPIGVGSYGIYMRLSVAAPEIAGRWGVAPFPGHLKGDGTIDRTVGGIAQQADVILAQTDKKKEAWEFLKWWTSADVQEQFGRELEALIGAEARWNTANIEAFTQLAWKQDDLKVITDSWKWARDMPVVLGGYFTGRHIVNAWNRVVLGNTGVRDSIEQAVKDINKELRMKQEEYGVEESIINY